MGLIEPMGEEILVVPRALLLSGPLHGFVSEGVDSYLTRVRAHAVFRPRLPMELDPSMKQIIPYLVVRHGSQLFLFHRSASGGEARLRSKYSIGVGGHINRRDAEGADDVVLAGVRRELGEELVIEGRWQARLVGVLNDDSNPVGQVHFGLVHVIELETPRASVREAETLTGQLVDPQEVIALRDRMETWSQLILDTADPMKL